MNDYWFYAVSIFLLVEEYKSLLTIDKNGELTRAFEMKKMFHASREEILAKSNEMISESKEIVKKEVSKWKGVWNFIKIIWMITGLFSQFTAIFVILIMITLSHAGAVLVAKDVSQYKKLRYPLTIIYTFVIGYLLYFGLIIKFI